MSQGVGLRELAETAVRLSASYPNAEFAYYPGDLTSTILKKAEEFQRHSPSFALWLDSDFSILLEENDKLVGDERRFSDALVWVRSNLAS
ncbi:hypothetical protein H9L12_04915 [Sphingomonas rhizophila]|uniref:Uncharacterized protein n=1 Tax=Sphingomonas rhizophila TaxID=2071607 RepID=A0A7G9SDF1_9SPHN|nr:hypothetical protein [Sphingomonas rhizophila]QNN65876.1 hypothetical protein H9L12_04915 [Sphingomonas rhizophila]